MWRTLWQAKPSAQQLAWLLQQLATLVHAGVPLATALLCACEGPQPMALRQALRMAAQRLAEGDAFSQALARFPALFDAGLRAAVQAAEQSGQLAQTLAQLAEEQAQRARLGNQLRQALTYPAMIALTALVVVLTITLTVVPTFGARFAAAGASLPSATRWLLAASDLLLAHGRWLLLLVLLLTAGLAHYWPHLPRLRSGLLRLAIWTPLLGRMLEQAALTRWARTLSLLLSAGVPVLQALPMAGQAAAQARLQRQSQMLARSVGEGMSLHAAMREAGSFPALLIQLVAVGEHSGALAEMLARAAQYEALQAEYTLSTLTSLLEPLAMLLLGGLCAVLIWALYLPMFELGETVLG